MQTKKILVIEDNSDAAEVLEAYLLSRMLSAADGYQGLRQFALWKPDLILLDMMLPGIGGNEVLQAVRRESDVPVIIVTAMGDAEDRIGTLRFGADDYVCKPYHPGEVIARVHAVLRRAEKTDPSSDIASPDGKIIWQSLTVFTETMLATVNDGSSSGYHLELTPTEFSLLTELVRSPFRPLSRQYLLENCIPESDALVRVVDTHVYNLRKKLAAAGMTAVLLNVRGFGYRFSHP